MSLTNEGLILSPSMMCADMLHLRTELDALMQEDVDLLHIDIMDGQYVPNFTMGNDIATAMHTYSGITLDYHLMIGDVDRSLDIFTQTPGSIVTFHPETSRHPVRTIQHIQDRGCRPGIAIDPAMSLEQVKHLLPLVEVACLMTVNPGYSGQKILPFCLDKLRELHTWKQAHHPELLLEVDGNVSWENIPDMVAAGANILVLGTSSVFCDTPRAEAYQKLYDLLQICNTPSTI
jgi:ribulose-phosphate 3-epimerase